MPDHATDHDGPHLLVSGAPGAGKSTLVARLLAATTGLDFVHQYSLAGCDVGTTNPNSALDPHRPTASSAKEHARPRFHHVTSHNSSSSNSIKVIAIPSGSIQGTASLVDAASHASATIILVDARNGLTSKARYDATICSLTGIRHVAIAINKMDLVDYDPAVYKRLAADFYAYTHHLTFSSVAALPLCAISGENIAKRSERMTWHEGPTVFDWIHALPAGAFDRNAPFRLPIESATSREQDSPGASGRIVSGRISVGDEIIVASSGQSARISAIVSPAGAMTSAGAEDQVTLITAPNITAKRGDVLCTPEARPDVADQFSAHLISVHTDTLLPARRYEMRIGTHSVAASVIHLKHRLNIDNHNKLAASILRANEIGYADMSTAIPVAFDRYTDNRSTGAFVLVDPATDTIIALGLVEHPLRRATNVYREAALIDKTARAEMKSQSPKCIWLTGLSGSGKSTLAKALEQRLHQFGRHTMVLDGDNLRHGLNKDLGFTEADRVENIRRAGEVARLMVESGIIVICSFISPFHADRAMVRELFPPGEFVEVFVDTPLEECIRRDRKGLYAKAIRGEIPNFTGIGSPYEPPTQAELVIRFTPKNGDAEVSLEDRIAADVYRIIELVDR